MNLNHIAKKPFFDLFYRTPCMPQMMRAAMYDATLMGANGQSRGASGTLMLQNQLAIAQSKELTFAMTQVQEIVAHGNHITKHLSNSDLIQLGGYAAVEYCGGPSMIFNMGREDIAAEGDAVQHAPETHPGSLVVQGLAQSDLAPEEFVALMGGFTIGFCGDEKAGKHTRWCQNPYVFDNTYFQELLLKDMSMYFKSDADLKLVQNASLKTWVEAYAQDEELFFRNFAKAHVKISERGQEHNLLSEFEPHRAVDGGYLEESRAAWMLQNVRIHYTSYMTGRSIQEIVDEELEAKALEIEDGSK